MLITNPKIDKIQIYACKFRLAIEQCDKKILPVYFRDFPRGSCGDASLLLAKYFKNVGLGDFSYVVGIYNENHTPYTHAWLKQRNVIVDITADQFDDIQQKVIVTTNSSWHEKFDIQSESTADLQNYDPFAIGQLLSCYNTIKTYIRHLQELETKAQ